MRQRPFFEVASETWGIPPVSAYSLLDPRALVMGEDFDAGDPTPTPGPGGRVAGIIYDAKIGRFKVRFVFLIDKDGEPHFAAIWTPNKPKRLKPKLVEQFRRERLGFSKAVAQEFDVGIQVTDRLDRDGQPRRHELGYPDGRVEPAPRQEVH